MVEPSVATCAPTILCEARGVSHDFTMPNKQTLRVLENVDLAIRANEVVALLGPSGCGKSTILRILAGLVHQTQGEVLYHGQPLVGLNPGVAIVFQSFALFPWMTVAENVSAVLVAAGLPTPAIEERVAKVIRLVGLGGFKDAHPRQLSGGMKQRVGIARALAVDPEVLFLDEPFSQVDALTAESLRAELIDIWSAAHRNPLSVLMVSHNIEEVVFMADRIVILGANPGRVLTCVDNPLPRPRDFRSTKVQQLVEHLHDIITHAHMPDVATPPLATPPIGIEPIPAVSSGEIVGLLEYLDARAGRGELFGIAGDTNKEFGRTIAVVKAAEMLDFVDTPGRLVILEADGRRFVKAGPAERKTIWREQLLKLRLFRTVFDMIQRQPDHEIEKDLVLETIVMNMPQENYNKIFDTFLRWSRVGGLFAYDEDTQRLSIPSP
ncbi:MAG: nitrate/sulfonate/bicarbonate ABC transporter ATP-binding protein [Planctomycetes bacterium]|nr:nitrate/sulfonate/bicarbonate ABC transporter ATP-binding protein [Planctomycetota bacterium]MBI3845559.1 nitrate/sulfonate/bicarbonate ABC transporter ATP-binding protein [Planctomycetota bacterium]